MCVVWARGLDDLPQGGARIGAKDPQWQDGRSRCARVAAEPSKYLGVLRYRSSHVEERTKVGLSNGLAVTMFGGGLLATK